MSNFLQKTDGKKHKTPDKSRLKQKACSVNNRLYRRWQWVN